MLIIMLTVEQPVADWHWQYLHMSIYSERTHPSRWAGQLEPTEDTSQESRSLDHLRPVRSWEYEQYKLINFTTTDIVYKRQCHTS